MFIQGGGGNLAMGTQLKGEVMRASSKDYKHLGQTLGEEVVAAVETFAPLTFDNLMSKE